MSSVKPTPEMIRWHDYELGLFFHYDIEVFQPTWTFWNPEPLPDVSVWKPELLDTDQWLATAASAGARYAMLTAKHGTGFCLWPTKVHDYHVGNSPVPRDVVGEFVASCHKYGIKPGLYYSLGGVHLRKMCENADGSLNQEKLNGMLLRQVEELIVNYGPLCEMWFDGGILRAERGGPDIPGLLKRIAPDLVCFGGCPGISNVLRWSGSEQGVAMPECWSTAHYLTDPERQNVTCDSPGDPDDPIWAPVEVDIPSRDVLRAYLGGWMHLDGDESKTYSGDYLFARYLTSVGRNANLLIGCVPNKLGLISKDQVQSFGDLGEKIRRELGVHLAQCTEMKDGDRMEVILPEPVDVRYIEIMEDQTEGQHVLEWIVETRWPEFWCEKDKMDQWIPVAQGQSIGHKRIIPVKLLRGYAFRIRILRAKPGARLTSFKLYGERVYD